MKRHWEQEYERAAEEVVPRREGGSCSGQSDGQKRGIAQLTVPLVQQTRVLGKALYRTLAHYSDLTYAELVRLVERAARAAKAPASADADSSASYGVLGAFLTHLLQAPLILARNPLAILVSLPLLV